MFLDNENEGEVPATPTPAEGTVETPETPAPETPAA